MSLIRIIIMGNSWKSRFHELEHDESNKRLLETHTPTPLHGKTTKPAKYDVKKNERTAGRNRQRQGSIITTILLTIQAFSHQPLSAFRYILYYAVRTQKKPRLRKARLSAVLRHTRIIGDKQTRFQGRTHMFWGKNTRN